MATSTSTDTRDDLSVDGQALEDAGAIASRARLRLLQSLASRGSAEIAAFVIPPTILFLFSRTSTAAVWPLVLWCVAMMAFSGMLLWLRGRLKREWAALGSAVADDASLDRWQRTFALSAAAGGLLWSAALLCTHAGANYEFRLFVYLVLCGVIASATTYLAPMPRVFWPFAAAIYLPMLLAAPWYFEKNGIYMIMLLLLYGFTVVRHAMASRRFVQQQFEQERERHALAVQIHQAKVLAEEALAEKNWFLSAASHDLRQPLQALGFMLESARQRNHDSEVAHALSEVQACTRDLDMMFNDLLDLSRLDSGTFALRMQPVPLHAVLLDAERMFAPVARQQGLALRIRLPRRLNAVVHADLSLVRQMVFNLVHNALRYTRDGSVLLACRRRGGSWCIQVWDTGVGISEEEAGQVFSAHYQVARLPAHEGDQALPGMTGSARGRGLGLAVVARSAQRLGVAHGVHSRLGRGSCFWLQWPAGAAIAEHDFQPSVIPLQDVEPAGLLHGRVLLLDRNDVQRRQWAMLLQDWGLIVGVATSVGQALALCEEGGARPDFVLSSDAHGVDSPHGTRGTQPDDAPDALADLERLLASREGLRGAVLSASPAMIQRAEDEGHLAFALPLAPHMLHAVLRRVLGSGASG